MAVADEVGGHAAGEVANRVALIELQEFLSAHEPWEATSEILKLAVAKANKEIYLAVENADCACMASTLVAALTADSKTIRSQCG